MRLLIKQRVFSWSDTYDIYDEEAMYGILSGQRCLHLDIRSMSMMRHMLRLE